MPEQMKRRPILAALLSAIGSVSVSSASKAIPPELAPPEWVVYAEAVTGEISVWLSADAPPTPRIRAVLDATRPAPDQTSPPLVIKLWISRDGTITRVEFSPLSDAEADMDLHALLTGKRLAPPPRGMRFPMRVALQMKPQH